MASIPEKRIRAGAISATIWKNQIADFNSGETKFYKTIALDRAYKDKSNQWQHTNSFRINDLPRLALVAQKAYEYLVMSESHQNTSETETPVTDQEEVVM